MNKELNYKLKDVFPIKECYYLNDINKKDLDIFWQDLNDNRIKDFEEQYNKYGFDSRETWSLYYVISIFMYTRLKCYIDYYNVDLNNDNEKEFKEDLEKMLFTFGSIIKDYKTFDIKYNNKEYKEKFLEGFDAFKRSFFKLWW